MGIVNNSLLSCVKSQADPFFFNLSCIGCNGESFQSQKIFTRLSASSGS